MTTIQSEPSQALLKTRSCSNHRARPVEREICSLVRCADRSGHEQGDSRVPQDKAEGQQEPRVTGPYNRCVGHNAYHSNISTNCRSERINHLFLDPCSLSSSPVFPLVSYTVLPPSPPCRLTPTLAFPSHYHIPPPHAASFLLLAQPQCPHAPPSRLAYSSSIRSS